MADATHDRPLAGIRVIDVTTVLMGPFATQMLGDMGADVIKIEPLQGDSHRTVGRAHSPDLGLNFLNTGRNKRSLALDLKHPGAAGIVSSLVKGADIFISNMRPAALKRLGFDYEALRSVNDRLIHVQPGRLRAWRPLCRPAGLRRPDPGGRGHPLADPAGQRRRAGLCAAGAVRPRGRPGGPQPDPERLVRAPARRRRPRDRGADVRDDGAPGSGRSSRPAGLRAGQRSGGLSAPAVASSPALSHQGRPYRCAALRRPRLAQAVPHGRPRRGAAARADHRPDPRISTSSTGCCRT